MTKMH